MVSASVSMTTVALSDPDPSGADSLSLRPSADSQGVARSYACAALRMAASPKGRADVLGVEWLGGALAHARAGAASRCGSVIVCDVPMTCRIASGS